MLSHADLREPEMGAEGSDFNGRIMLTLLYIRNFLRGIMSTVLSSSINALLMPLLTFGWSLNENGTADGALFAVGGGGSAPISDRRTPRRPAIRLA